MITLTGKEILGLTLCAGFSVVENYGPDELETEWDIQDCPAEGVLNDDNEIEHYRYVAWLAEYPEEGAFPLGDPITTEQNSTDKGVLP